MHALREFIRAVLWLELAAISGLLLAGLILTITERNLALRGSFFSLWPLPSDGTSSACTGFYKVIRTRRLLSAVWRSYGEDLERQLLPSISSALEEYVKLDKQ